VRLRVPRARDARLDTEVLLEVEFVGSDVVEVVDVV
jgi:hypothetical protein